MGDDEIRQKYLELQVGAEQMKQMHAQLQAVEAKSRELELNTRNLGGIKGSNNAAMLAPVVEGIFLRAELKSDADVIVNVGAGVCVKKTVGEAIAILKEKQAELNQYAKELAIELEMASEGMRKLEEELNGMIKASR